MTRVSLREAYDNKDVVAQIYAIRDTAESAEDSAEQAVTTANTASEHVDALVPQVEQAVENANTASETVAGYENRLGAVEGDVVQLNTDVGGIESDLNAVTLRVTTAEGDIVTIQGRVTALETADGQNVKLTGNASVYGRKAFNAISTRNVNGQGTSTTCLELFRFRPLSGKDHRFNFFRHLSYGVCLTFLRIQTVGTTAVGIIDGSKTPIGTSTGNITIGAGITSDGWCVVYEKQEASCVFCSLLTAFTGSRYPIQEANVDMSNQCNIIDPDTLSGVAEVTL